MEHFDIKQVYNNYIKLNKAQRKSVLLQLQKEGIPVKAIEAYTYPETPGLVHLFFHFEGMSEGIPYFQLTEKQLEIVRIAILEIQRK